MGEHYFAADPAGPSGRRDMVVRLAGRDLTVQTAGGVFSPGHVDGGTRVLLDHLPDPAPGDLLDLGCGWGPLALEAGIRSPTTRVWALDVNARARDLAACNARRLGLSGVRVVGPDDVPAGLRFTTVWSNPPIRVGKATLHELLVTWVGRLTDDGTAWLVVSRNLGADSLQPWLADALGRPVDRVASARGFRVLRVGPRA